MINIEALRNAWSSETCALGPDGPVGGYRNPRGQCAVTALLVQDILGGDIVRAEVTRYPTSTLRESHYWNRIPNVGELDLTRSQYPDDMPIPRGEVVPRSRLLDGERAVAAKTAFRYGRLVKAYENERGRW